jgi:hypothetical protein
MLSLFRHRTRSTVNSTAQISANRTVAQFAAFSASDEGNGLLEQPATYDEVLPYLMLSMVAAI